VATDARIDDYIAKAAPFARPILEHLRAFVHATIPEADETIKWGMPHFTVNGRNLAGMAAFKAHCAFAVHGEGRQGSEAQDAAMGQYGKIASLEDMPDEAKLAETLRAVSDRLKAGAPKKAVANPAQPKPEIAMPDDLAQALSTDARSYLDRLAPSYRREYLEWIVSAKRPETRARRIESAAAQLAEGRKLNWKYER
jgi:uncharacterized protein YdeI (YjbR/CyaY-like superfamily)